MNQSRFTQTNSAFAMRCGVEINIKANAEIVWGLLTDAKGFSRWNSTVTGIEGQILEGERLRLHVPGTNRTFTPRVSGVVTARRMIWSDGLSCIFRGVRTFVIEPREDRSTDFVMEEHFSGLMFALVKPVLPDFRPIFEAYAHDLKREAVIKASGAIVRVEPDEFRKLVGQNPQGLVVHAVGGIFSASHKYLMGFKGLAFSTSTRDPVHVPGTCQVVEASKIWIP